MYWKASRDARSEQSQNFNYPALSNRSNFCFFVSLNKTGRIARIMLIRLKLPKTILWVTNLFLIFLLIFTLSRLVTFFVFRPDEFSFGDLLPSFLLGLRYDLRWIAIVLLPIVFISLIPEFSPFYS